LGGESPSYSVATVDLHIEGRVEGDVRCATLVLGDSSTIKGSIFADRVRIGGTVHGSVETKDLAVESTARVNGDVTYERLRVASGGLIEGSLRCKASEAGDPLLKLVEAEA
jgi:cytoskeletal protein CcmA (bactofilin family)